MSDAGHTVVETTGPNEDAAVATGLEQLGVDRGAVHIEVLEEAKSGLMGLGAREARVRLTVHSAADGDPERGGEPSAPRAESYQPDGDSASAADEPSGMDGADTARQVLLDLLARLDITEAKIDASLAEAAPGEDEPPVILDVRGPGTSGLIGHSGKTLAALQHVTRLMVGQSLSRRMHLVIDVDGFKARREETLRGMAQRIARQAAQDAETVVLEPMPSHERRVIHLTLREDPEVTTESIGEGDRRRVSIIPRA
ncbi:MAG: hypothetical protein E3J64_00955 [Anaerolineales bacterium]|nr:MAG: hypothetical protein E3J64_00955 [Anaerolineales bacterium]